MIYLSLVLITVGLHSHASIILYTSVAGASLSHSLDPDLLEAIGDKLKYHMGPRIYGTHLPWDIRYMYIYLQS